MKKILVRLINIYQCTLSFEHSWLGKIFSKRTCRFYPTCSEYAKEAINKKGAMQGMWLTCLRLSRCHPWHPGGIDNVK